MVVGAGGDPVERCYLLRCGTDHLKILRVEWKNLNVQMIIGRYYQMEHTSLNALDMTSVRLLGVSREKFI
jgi:hypothetical protein